jgi:hypothetical protein
MHGLSDVRRDRPLACEPVVEPRNFLRRISGSTDLGHHFADGGHLS